MRILHYNDEETELHRYLAERGEINVILSADADVLSFVRNEEFDAAFVGLHPHGLQLIRLLQRKNPDCLVTIITADRNTRMAVEAMKLGAFDYLLSPLDFTEVERTVIMMNREYQSQRERKSLEGQLVAAQTSEPTVEPSPAGRTLAQIVGHVERDAITQTLRNHQGNISEAAKSLDISRTTLYAKVREYGIEMTGG